MSFIRPPGRAAEASAARSYGVVRTPCAGLSRRGESVRLMKVNRAITEGRARFLKTYRGIEDGEACERHADALAALAAGTATGAQLLALRPHLRHCAACRAAMRELRFSRTRRIALLLPGLPALRRLGHLFARAANSDVSASAQYAAASGGGGRLGPVAALAGLCLGGAGAAVCVGAGALPAPPLIAHVAAKHHAAAAPARHRRTVRRPQGRASATPAPTRMIAAVATPHPVATVVVARRTVAAKATRHRAVIHAARKAAASPSDFDFENRAPAATPAASPPPVTATAANAGGGGSPSAPATQKAAATHEAAAKAHGTEFGFESG